MTASAWLLSLTLRSTVVLAMAFLLVAVLRRASAAARHRLLTLTAIGLLFLPALPGALPRWDLPFLPHWMEMPSRGSEDPPARRRSATTSHVDLVVSAQPQHLAAVGRVEETAQQSTHPAAAPGRSEPPGTWLGEAATCVWLLGALASLLGLARALQRERRLLKASRPLAGPWLDTLAETRHALALNRPVRLLTSDEIQTPLTGGWREPAVILPSTAVLWSDERRRVVVQHELVHVVRSDTLRHLAWRLVGALYWFHPLARLVGRQSSVVSEQACDEAVLDLGTRPSVYARHLLEIAESLRARPLNFVNALPMVDRSQLERRLHMILDPNRSPGRGGAIAAVCLALLTGTVLGVGAAMPVPLAAGSGEAARGPKPAEPARPLQNARGNVCLEGISGTFSGSFSESDSGTELHGLHNGDFAVQQHLGDGRRLCARVHGPVRFDERDGSIRDLPTGSSVVVETRAGRTRSQRMLVTAEQGVARYQWWLDGNPQVPDDAARAWLADALELVAAFRAIGSLQGEVGSLQGEIGSIHGEVGSLQGEIGSIQGEQGSLQGRIGSIQGEQGTLQGAIGRHQGAIGGLQGARWQASDAQQARMDLEIEEHEAAIRKLEAEIVDRGISGRIAAAEAELRAFEGKGRRQIAELEQRIRDVKAEERIGQLERQIEGLHADDRIRELERRSKPALERLNDRIERLGR